MDPAQENRSCAILEAHFLNRITAIQAITLYEPS
jgi:hypothetical protein